MSRSDRHPGLALARLSLAMGCGVFVLGCVGSGDSDAAGEPVADTAPGIEAVAPVAAGESTTGGATGDEVGTNPSKLPLPPIALEAVEPEAAAAGGAAQALTTGRQLMQAGRFPEAIQQLSAAAALEPGNADLLRLLGNAQARINNMPAALKTFQQATLIAPDSAGIHFELAMVALSMANLDRAEAAARRVLEIDPDNHRAQELVATVLHRRGDYAGVLALLESGLDQQPDRVQARFLIGLAYFGLQDLVKARSALEEVVRRQPGHAPAQLNLAEVLTRLGDTAGATQARSAFERLKAERER